MTDTRNVVPPNLPIAPEAYDRRYFDQLNNVLRLFFNSLANSTNSALDVTNDLTDTSTATDGLAGGATGEVLTKDSGTDYDYSWQAVAGGALTDGDKGDITVSSSGTVWTIDNDAVSYGKIQNVSATDKLLGRSTAGSGNVEEIPCTAAGRALLDDATAGDQRTTLGLGTAATYASTAFEPADATILKDADIGVTVQAYGSYATTTDIAVAQSMSYFLGA